MIKNYKFKIKNSSGQVAIIVLLVSAVMMTLGLSMSKKETTQVKINTNDELLKKAFDTAESGINYYLGTGGTSYSSPDATSFANINAIKIGDGSDKIDFGEYTPMGSSESFWLVNHLDNGSIGTTYFTGPNIDVCSANFTGQVEVSVFSTTALRRSLVDIADNCSTVDVGTVTNPILLTVTPLSGGGKFYVEANNGGVFASQGTDIVSEGSSGGANKKLSIRQRYKLPGFLISGMMAEGSILSD